MPSFVLISLATLYGVLNFITETASLLAWTQAQTFVEQICSQKASDNGTDPTFIQFLNTGEPAPRGFCGIGRVLPYVLISGVALIGLLTSISFIIGPVVSGDRFKPSGPASGLCINLLIFILILALGWTTPGYSPAYDDVSWPAHELSFQGEPRITSHSPENASFVLLERDINDDVRGPSTSPGRGSGATADSGESHVNIIPGSSLEENWKQENSSADGVKSAPEDHGPISELAPARGDFPYDPRSQRDGLKGDAESPGEALLVERLLDFVETPNGCKMLKEPLRKIARFLQGHSPKMINRDQGFRGELKDLFNDENTSICDRFTSALRAPGQIQSEKEADEYSPAYNSNSSPDKGWSDSDSPSDNEYSAYGQYPRGPNYEAVPVLVIKKGELVITREGKELMTEWLGEWLRGGAKDKYQAPQGYPGRQGDSAYFIPGSPSKGRPQRRSMEQAEKAVDEPELDDKYEADVDEQLDPGALDPAAITAVTHNDIDIGRRHGVARVSGTFLYDSYSGGAVRAGRVAIIMAHITVFVGVVLAVVALGFSPSNSVGEQVLEKVVLRKVDVEKA